MQDLFAVHMKNTEIRTYDLSFNKFSCPIFLRACEFNFVRCPEAKGLRRKTNLIPPPSVTYMQALSHNHQSKYRMHSPFSLGILFVKVFI